MRKQVIKMIKEIQQKEHQTKPTKHISFKEILAGNYVYVPSNKEKKNWEYIEKTQNVLITSLQNLFNTALVHVGTSTSIEIEWKDKKWQVIIELSLNGNLASVFKYGNVSQKALSHVDKHLQDNNLLKLLDDEITELENQGIYHKIF
ncbi:MAG: hypothetical protein B6242_04465 [Anaerolineaceae bacterium 4572_78]|nr:MAG: hypothetical protein B6242_04465 [Anaerolineaceae bacterium 4572_78]